MVSTASYNSLVRQIDVVIEAARSAQGAGITSIDRRTADEALATERQKLLDMLPKEERTSKYHIKRGAR